MLTHFFVTGTDSRVGKTIVSRALLQAMIAQGKVVLGYKPIATGSQELADGVRNKDAVTLQKSSSVSYPLSRITPYALSDEDIFTSHLPKNIFEQMTDGLHFLRQEAETVVVEGCDGWRTLITPKRRFSDWVVQLNMPVILVVGIQEGCVSQALLAAEAIIADGVPLLGWVANRINPCLAHYAETISAIRQNIKAPLLGEIPYLPRAESREMAQYLDLSLLNELTVA
ncbi:MAG: dethiobiotin synthase [Rouxiella aceris]|jgi:dethiobiotin synthetase|uniref:dethiobiotin synthase n=1 Tax=Rouxiella aceris TaxID=2703884 RepID=UPI00284E5B94|nr:dethiobiotin synthase [Rouxiella aceris]MDR3434081.1 dethiobiotin synthase [Rouxiella aceris]